MTTLWFVLVAVLAIIISSSQAWQTYDKCDLEHEKVGCFADKPGKERALPEELLNERDKYSKVFDGHVISWTDYNVSLHDLACRCAAKTREKGYKVFGLQFYGECWSGPGGEHTYSKHGVADRKKCFQNIYSKSDSHCDEGKKQECIGEKFTNYVYRLKESPPPRSVDGGYSKWSDWLPCSKTCGNGTATRRRTCTNPKPEKNGKNCSRLGPAVATKPCSEGVCHVHCKKALDIGIIIDGSSSIRKRNFAKMIEFLEKFTTYFTVSRNGTHFGAIVYSTYAKMEFSMADSRYYERQALIDRIETICLLGGGTRTDRALEVASKRLFTRSGGDRSDKPNVLILFTDGHKGKGSKPYHKVLASLKEKGVQIIVIGIGQFINMKELLTIATGKQTNVITIKKFDGLQKIMGAILNKSCTGFKIPAGSKCVSALGMQNRSIPDSGITASSMWDANHSPSRARLGTTRVGLKRGAWSARKNDANQWIQVDFGKVAKVTGIATQGRQDLGQWVKSFAVQYSLGAGLFVYYKRGHVFKGNSDRNSIVFNVFKPAIIARYIRIRPKSWRWHISMRFELYGCTKGFIVPIGPICMGRLSLRASQLSASSEWDRNHGATNAMLHHQAGGGKTGAWSSRHNDLNQWLQVDLGQISKVTRVSTQGRSDHNQWIKTYTIEYSVFGSAYLPYKVGGVEKVFTGNVDRYTVNSHKLANPIIARFIRFRPKSWYGHISMRVAVYGCTSGFPSIPAPTCGLALGLQSNVISDSQMSASSEWNSGHRAANARLHFHAGSGRTGAWSSKSNNADQWLQVDFRKIAKITKVATQGRQDANQWVKSYTLSYSRDGVFWKEYREVLTGNSDRGTVVSHDLKRVIYARFLRINPRTWYGHISMRAEIYGCTSGFQVPTETCVSALGMQSRAIPDSHITASSMWDGNHSPSRARLGTTKVGHKRGAWSAKTNDAGQWIQIDLGKVAKVTRIATQGRQDYNQWVRSYTLQYSKDGGHFENYKGGQMLMGNKDKNSIVGNILDPAIIGRYIRIRPKSWYGHISMRFELYGCTKGFNVPVGPTCESKLSSRASQLSASSEWDRNHGATNAMLHHQAGGGKTGAWSSRHNDLNQWLQVDLKQLSKVTRVSTQGRSDHNQWVETYTIEYSLCGSVFTPYREGGVVKVFAGNVDRNGVKSHKLSNPIIAIYVRIRPKSWHRHISMRIALYGCTSGFIIPPKPTCSGLINLGDWMLLSSSDWNYKHRAANGKLHFPGGGGRTGAWSARYNNVNQWLLVDFDRQMKITSIATQGRYDNSQWVKAYTVEYSRNGVTFKPYKENGAVKVFTGNNDRSSVVTHELAIPIVAEYIRIKPKAWHRHISMRVGMNGCPTGEEPASPPCHQAMDVGIIMDRSGSIGTNNFRRAQDFIARLFSHFEYASPGTRFGIIAYNSKANVILKFNEATTQNPAALMRRVYGIRYLKGGTRTDRALALANTDLFSSRGGYRGNVPNVLFVLTDGKTNRGSVPYHFVLRPLWRKKVKLIAVGVGKGVNMKELLQISGSKKRTFFVKGFEVLSEKLKDILDASCPSK